MRTEQLGWTLAAAAEAAGVSVRTISKWRRRYRVEGEQGLLDRYGAIYRNSEERRRALAGWIDHYTRRRPHRSLGRQTPLERLHALNRNNVLGSYI